MGGKHFRREELHANNFSDFQESKSNELKNHTTRRDERRPKSFLDTNMQKEFAIISSMPKAKIWWLNYGVLLDEAQREQNEEFLDAPDLLRDEIVNKCGHSGLLTWTRDGEYEILRDDEYIAFPIAPVVTYTVSNTAWPWNVMVKDMLALSNRRDYKNRLFLITFDANDDLTPLEHIFIMDGRITAAMYDKNDHQMVPLF